MWFDFLKGVMVGFAIGWLVIASELRIGVPHFDTFKRRYPHKGEARTSSSLLAGGMRLLRPELDERGRSLARN